MIAAFFPKYFCILIPSVYICSLSSPLELPERWTRVRRNSLHWHMSDPRRIILSDQHPWTFTCSNISYEAPSWFLLLGRIVNKMWDLNPMQRPKFLLPHIYIYIYIIFPYLSFFIYGFPSFSLSLYVKIRIEMLGILLNELVK